MFNVLMYFLTKTIDSNMGRLDLLYAFVWGLLFMHSRFKSKNVTKKMHLVMLVKSQKPEMFKSRLITV